MENWSDNEEETEYKKALIIVDMQNDFCEEYEDKQGNKVKAGSLAVTGSFSIVEKINELRKNGNFDYIFTSRDYHPENHISFADNHTDAEGNPLKPLTDIRVKETGLLQRLWPRHCVQGSDGCKYIDTLVIDEEKDIEVKKGQLQFIDSYSAFGGQGEETNLAWNLRERYVKKVFCVGLAFDFCVGSTAVSAA